MNVRIQNQNLRFKIVEDELKTLLEGKAIHAKVALLDKTIVATIDPQGDGKMMDPQLVLEGNDVCLNLLILPSAVQELSDMGRSRKGLTKEVGGVLVSIQVDMRGDSRKAC